MFQKCDADAAFKKCQAEAKLKYPDLAKYDWEAPGTKDKFECE